MRMTDKDEQAKAKMSVAGRGVLWNNILVLLQPEHNEQLRAVSWPEVPRLT